MNEKVKVQSNGSLNVYYAVKQKIDGLKNVYPTERQKEIDACQNLKVKSDKYFVWKLLEYGLKDTFNIAIEDLDFFKNKSGKWECKNCFFSLSHSEDIVAVAISNRPVGVDIEVIKQPKVLGLEKKILTDEELAHYCDLPKEEQTKYLIQKWTQKESIFKMLDLEVFKPKEIACHNVETICLVDQNKEYSLSIAGDNVKEKKIIKVGSESNENWAYYCN